MENQFSEQKLGASYWFVTNKLLIKNIIAIILMIFVIFIIAYNLYLLIFNFALFRQDYSAIIAGYTTNSIDNSQLRQTVLPQSIQIGQVETYANKSDHDIVVTLTNPNISWWATFDYQIRLGQELTDKKGGFIMPNETKTVLSLSIEDGDLASQVILSNIQWTKEINFTKIKNDRYKFDIQNIKFIPSKELGIGDEVPISRLEFTVINQSAYNYRNVNFFIFLNSGSRIMAINQLSASNLMSGQKTDLEISFFQNLPNISSAEVMADVNYLEDKSFLKY